MRKLFWLLMLFIVPAVAHAQVKQRYYGRFGRSEMMLNSCILADSNRAVVGYAYNGSSSVGSDAFAMRLDTGNNVLWAKEIATSGTDRFLSVAATADSGFVAVGYTNASGAFTSPTALIVRFSSSGTVLWSRTFKNSANGECFHNVTVMPNGHIIACGGYNYSPPTIGSMLVDLDASGAVLWTKLYDAVGSDAAWDVKPKGNDIIATGYWQTATSYYDGYLLEVDESNGNLKWARSFDYGSLLTNNTGQWPQILQLVGNKIYADVYNFDNYSNNVVIHALVSFDTSGLNPACLEYKFPGMNYSETVSSLVVPPSDIYLVQSPSNVLWDNMMSASNTPMNDEVITKVKSMSANGLVPVYTRKLGNTGSQGFRKMNLVNGKLLAYQAVTNDPFNQAGVLDAFGIEADTSFPVTGPSCAVSVSAPLFANPTVYLTPNFSFPSQSSITWLQNQTALTPSDVVIQTTDPCAPPELIINKYAAVLDRATCLNGFTVDTATGFNPGDTVIMIQMKGASIDSSNSASFGNINNLNGAGNYERNVISSVAGNVITLKYKVRRQYDIPTGKVQFVRVPNFRSYAVTQKLSCLPWTGTKGGVFAINVYDTLQLNARIDVSGKGFTGGQPLATSQYGCNRTDYYYPSTNNEGGMKGEGIAIISAAKMYGRGHLANGGGGGNDHNAGGGGGGNAAAGGLGGNQFALGSCATTAAIGGLGGASLGYSVTNDRVFLGGGGGAGHGNDFAAGPGGNGGGLVFITTDKLIGNNQLIVANGADAPQCPGATPLCQDDARGGGGGAGAVLASVNTYVSGMTFYAKGGRGSSPFLSGTTTPVGPGGGGGGGAVWHSGAVLPAGVKDSVGGGQNGVVPQYGNTPYGAQPGATGVISTGYLVVYPIDTFAINTIVPGFSDSTTACRSRKFKNTTTVTATGVASWSWSFGDGGTSTLQTPTHSYAANGAYPVRLVVVDSNGCKDSITHTIQIQCTDTIINKYAAVMARNNCDNSFVVDTATGFGVGDTVLVIQMKGAVIDSSNSTSFGTVLAYNSAGNWEQNVVKSVTGNSITLRYKLKQHFDIPAGKVQFVRIPSFASYTISKIHTALPWTGTKGAVFAINVTGNLNLYDDIDVSSKGFTGGTSNKTFSATMNCSVQSFYQGANKDSSAQKGEGITTVSASRSYGRGALANGGGGGNAHNAGGGGGSNAGGGGFGAKEYQGCSPTLNITGGIGGVALTVGSGNKVFAGGGGGAGHANDGSIVPGNGGAGGGLVFIRAGNISGNGLSIRANGGAAPQCSSAAANCTNDGNGGGGGAGSVMLMSPLISSPLNVESIGGKGGDVYLTAAMINMAHGPGGGGGGGLVWTSTATLSSMASVSTAGGANGVIPQQNSNAWGALPGMNGITLNNLQEIIDTETYYPNSITPGFRDSVVSCYTRQLFDTSKTTTTGIAGYAWYAGNTFFSGLQNPLYTFPGYGSFPVRLVVTDSNGCSDSVTRNVVIPYNHFARAGNDTVVCNGGSVMLHAGGGIKYSWSPAGTLSWPDSATTSAAPTIATTYMVTVTDGRGCIDTASVGVSIVPAPVPIEAMPHDTSVCRGRVFRLHAKNGVSYLWTPPNGLDNTTIANPEAAVYNSIVYVVTGKDKQGCISSDSIAIHIYPDPQVDAFSNDAAISCQKATVQLHASGASSYHWTPGDVLDDSTSKDPLARPIKNTVFTVTGTSAEGCIGTDTISVYSLKESYVFIPTAFSPNNDGKNDFFHPVPFCDFELDEFRVFNRWGQAVFQGYKIAQAWDGTYNGKLADVGVYFYMVLGHRPSTGEEVMFKGDVTLIR